MLVLCRRKWIVNHHGLSFWFYWLTRDVWQINLESQVATPTHQRPMLGTSDQNTTYAGDQVSQAGFFFRISSDQALWRNKGTVTRCKIQMDLCESLLFVTVHGSGLPLKGFIWANICFVLKTRCALRFWSCVTFISIYFSCIGHMVCWPCSQTLQGMNQSCVVGQRELILIQSPDEMHMLVGPQ